MSPYPSWAVSVSWGSSGAQLTHNLLENGCGVHGDDLGCLYMYDAAGQSSGGVISYNTVYGYGAATQSIKCVYLDAVTSGATVKGNVCASDGPGTADPGTFALFIHGGKNNSIIDNLFVIPYLGSFTDFFSLPNTGVWLGGDQTARGFPDTGMTGNSFEHNIVYSPGGWANPL